MARPKRLKDAIRVNFIIEKRHDKALNNLEKKTGLNRSEHVRRALDTYLETSPEECGYDISKEMQEVLTLLNYMRVKMNGKQKKKWELKKENLMPMFGAHWFKMKSVVEMASAILAKKGIDVMFEENIIPIAVPGTNRTRQHKYGFTLLLSASITKSKLESVINQIESDLKKFGKVIDIV